MPERELDRLLRTINPDVQSGQYVFCSLQRGEEARLGLKPLCLFREEEGVSVVLDKSEADELGLKYSGCWSLITCKVNSDLQAVGFLAAITEKLATSGISVNPVSAFHHDHLFVPADRADAVLKLVLELSQKTCCGDPAKMDQISGESGL